MRSIGRSVRVRSVCVKKNEIRMQIIFVLFGLFVFKNLV